MDTASTSVTNVKPTTGNSNQSDETENISLAKRKYIRPPKKEIKALRSSTDFSIPEMKPTKEPRLDETSLKPEELKPRKGQTNQDQIVIDVKWRKLRLANKSSEDNNDNYEVKVLENTDSSRSKQRKKIQKTLNKNIKANPFKKNKNAPNDAVLYTTEPPQVEDEINKQPQKTANPQIPTNYSTHKIQEIDKESKR